MTALFVSLCSLLQLFVPLSWKLSVIVSKIPKMTDLFLQKFGI